MEDVKGFELSTYCGLYCGACAIKNGQISGTAKALKGMLDTYDYPEWAPMMAEFVPATKHYPEFDGVLVWLTTQDCPGCRGGGGNPDCAVRNCAKERGFVGCWECDDRVGCEKLKVFKNAYPDMADNLERIREVGLAAWLSEQAGKVETGYSYYHTAE